MKTGFYASRERSCNLFGRYPSKHDGKVKLYPTFLIDDELRTLDESFCLALTHIILLTNAIEDNEHLTSDSIFI